MTRKKGNIKKNKRGINTYFWGYLVSAILIVLSIVLVALAAKKIELENNKEPFDTTINFEVDSRVEDIENMELGTNEILGWLKVQGTNIDYPIVYYSPKLAESETDFVWTEHMLLNNENRFAVYGHNVRNVSKNPIITDNEHTRFEQLMSFVYPEFVKNNKYIQLTIDGVDYVYKIYGVSFMYASDDDGGALVSDDEVADYIEKVQKESIYDFDIDVNESDELLSLITCTRYFGVTGENQFKIDARLMRSNEKIENYEVKTNENYDIIK